MKKVIIVIAALVVIGGGYYFFSTNEKSGDDHEEAYDKPKYRDLEETDSENDDFEEELDRFYEIDFIKEWYTERIYPPAFDFNVPIENMTLEQLGLLRNELYARKGYLFEDAVVRGHFNQFEWYQPIFDVPEFKVKLNPREEQLIEKIKYVEQEKKKQKFVEKNGNKLVAFNQLMNTSQFESVSGTIKESLAGSNVTIVSAKHKQLFYVYDHNHYEYVPNFITTDLYLQLLHKYFGSVLQSVEEEKFIPLIKDLLYSIHTDAITYYKTTSSKEGKDAASFLATYIAIGYTSLTDEKLEVPSEMEQYYQEELDKVNSHKGDESVFLNIRKGLTTYQQFTPRGNYTKTEALKKYFKCVKWLNYAPFYLDTEVRFNAMLLMANSVKNASNSLKSYNSFNKIVGLMAGDEDNLSMATVIQVLSDDYKGENIEKLFSKAVKNKIKKKLLALEVNKIREISPDSKRVKVMFTAGRYSMDAEVLINLVHVAGENPKRPFPKGLDFFAVLGNKTAKDLLLNYYKEGDQWDKYPKKLDSLHDQFKNFSDWNKNMYNKTIETLQVMNKTDDNYPLFMKTDLWKRKNLSTSLAAWSELKHDLILYSEQPFAAQGGQGGGPPPPKHLSYVEPNVHFWKNALSLLKLEEKFLRDSNVYTDHLKDVNEELTTLATFLLEISEKELKGEKISDEEFEKMSWIGATVEGILYRIFETDHLPEREESIAVVADVYNFKEFLEEAVGDADEIYVVANINGSYYITRGAVFSYYEFTSSSPLTDEKWRKMLNSPQKRPRWIQDLLLTPAKPLKTKPSYSLMGEFYTEPN